MSESDKTDKINDKHFARIVEIIDLNNDEFNGLDERLWSVSVRVNEWANEMFDALHGDG